ncbi:MAG: lectin-like protein [Cyanobacteria bacterium P01_F01_bin.143]
MEIIDNSAIAGSNELTFIDTNIDNYQSLIPEGNAAELVLLDSSRDGIEQITEILATKSDISAINIISHGNDAELQLGDSLLNQNNLQNYADELQSWSHALTEDADILLFGCDVASTVIGENFVQQLSDLTGADIAASDDLTGNAAFNGDWDLEFAIGAIEADPSWITDIAEDFDSVLINYNGNEYQLTSGNMTWAEAQAEAESLGGNLVTISDAAEQAWLEDTFGGNERLWTGLSDRATEGEFAWASGQAVDYTNWAPNQPNNFGQGEDFAALLPSGKWNDIGGNASLRGIIEIGDDNPNEPEPEVFSYNGNQYQLTSANIPWTQAQAEAESLGGNLVSINDAAEQAWLQDTFGGNGQLWTGLSDRVNESEFTWASGQAVNYTNWAANEPNNFGQGEDFTVLIPNGQWGDRAGNANLRGIIEIGGANPAESEIFNYNGNQYQLTSANLTWEQAQAEAESLGGNLVTISDAAEQAWVEDTFGGDQRLWIGLNDRTIENEFVWPNDEATNFTNWANNQPNNFGQGEDFVALQKNGQWNDYAGALKIRGVVEISSNDPGDPGVIGLETNSYQVNEGDGSVQVTVLRTQGSDGAISVDYQTVEASATENEDYTTVSGTLNFADGETSKSVTIQIQDDERVEGTEDFSFTIDNVRGGATLLAPRTALIDITDNDTIPDALSYNGNQYFLTSTSLTWEQAQAEAENFGGNLVSINDSLEESWLQSNFGDIEDFWIGINDRNTEGSFEWVSGQPVTYTNWAPGEPNDFGGAQDLGRMNFGAGSAWDDTGATTILRGIIEIGGANPRPNGSGNGLRGEYFDDIDFTNTKVIRTDDTVDFNWGTGSPDPAIAPDTFSVRWTGEIEARFSENYNFQTTTDDGVRLWINDQLVIDQFIDQAPTSHQGTIALTAGQRYDIELEYYENGGGAVAQLAWSSASQPFEIVPESQLYSEIIPGSITLTQETVFSGLNQPTAIDWSPGGDLTFIAEKGGVIKVADDGQVSNFIDISAQVNGVRDRGLLDIAVHPNFFDGSPYVYALYTHDPAEVFQNSGLAGPDGIGNRAARLTRITADANNGFKTAVTDSEVVILGTNSTWENFNAFANSTNDFNEPPAGILPDGSNLRDFLAADSESHTIGGVEFGPDGALYVSNGDGTSYNRVDPRTVRVQDIDNLSGKILRIDPITGEGLSDNPFFNGDANANRSKVYQYGLRNPFRITVDPTDGKVYTGDVGWTQWEEINAAGPGANFGWPYYEGGSGTNLQTGGYRDLPESQAFYASGGEAEPSILALNHGADGINAIVLGDIYRGTSFPEEYQGDLFFNDLGQGIVRNVSFDESGNVASVDTFATGANVVVQIVEGPDGNLYYVDLDDGLVGLWKFA